MCCLIAVLLAVILCVHAPPFGAASPIGWYADPATNDLIKLEDLRRADALLSASVAPASAPPASAFEAPGERSGDNDDAGTSEADGLGEESEAAPDRADAQRDMPQPQRAAVLNPDDLLPRMRGGLGRFYMTIDYPTEARLAGIQGELVLDFVVEPDGSVSGITLQKSLHPLCDSSAISSLQATRFIPARQNGKPVRTRARLPVRFKLLPPPSVSKRDTAIARR